MAQVNDCYYFSNEKAIFAVNLITRKSYTNGNNYHFRIVHKFNVVKTGYSIEELSFVISEKFFKGRPLVDVTIVDKIVKLLKVNNLVCTSILKTYPRIFPDKKYNLPYICHSYHGCVICYKDQCISFSESDTVFFTDRNCMLIYLPIECFFKIKEQCEKTIKLIDDIWPNSN